MEQKNKSLESSNQETSTNLMTDDEELDYYEDDEDELPPAMPEQLPSLIRLLVSRTQKSISLRWRKPSSHPLPPTSTR